METGFKELKKYQKGSAVSSKTKRRVKRAIEREIVKRETIR